MKKYVYVLNVVSCIGVIFMHTNTKFWTMTADIDWFIANIKGHALNFAVPIFFMITGITSLNYRQRYSTKEFFIKRIKKTVIPFVIWSLIGIVYVVVIKKQSMNLSLLHLIYSILKVNVIDYFWFFIPLFIVYLSIPIFSMLLKKELLEYILIMMTLFNIFIPFVSNSLKITLASNFQFSISGYIIYVLAGYYVSEFNMKSNFRRIIYVLGSFSWILLVFGTYMLSVYSGEINQLFMGYLNVPNFLISVALVVWLKTLDENNKINWCIKLTERIVPYTFGIYLVHWFVIQIIYDFRIVNTTSIGYTIFGAVLVFVICLLIVACIKKIPFVNKIIPD